MERGINIHDILPADAFLATRYFDQPRNFITRRIYYNDGYVRAFDGNEWWTVCHLSGNEIKSAIIAIKKSGLMSAKDLVVENCYDTALLTFAWCIDKQKGMVTNFSYPAVEHPPIEKLEEELDKIEAISSRSME